MGWGGGGTCAPTESQYLALSSSILSRLILSSLYACAVGKLVARRGHERNWPAGKTEISVVAAAVVAPVTHTPIPGPIAPA